MRALQQYGIHMPRVQLIVMRRYVQDALYKAAAKYGHAFNYLNNCDHAVYAPYHLV